MSIEDRLARLERHNFQMKIVLVIAVTAMLIGAKGNNDEDVIRTNLLQAKQVEIEGPNGKAAVVLGYVKGSGIVTTIDDSGACAIGGSFQKFVDTKSDTTVIDISRKVGSGHLSVFGSNSSIACVSPAKKQACILTTQAMAIVENDQQRVSCGVSEKGIASFLTRDAFGKLEWIGAGMSHLESVDKGK